MLLLKIIHSNFFGVLILEVSRLLLLTDAAKLVEDKLCMSCLVRHCPVSHYWAVYCIRY